MASAKRSRCARCERRTASTLTTTIATPADTLINWPLCEPCRRAIVLAVVLPVRTHA